MAAFRHDGMFSAAVAEYGNGSHAADSRGARAAPPVLAWSSRRTGDRVTSRWAAGCAVTAVRRSIDRRFVNPAVDFG